MKRALSWISLHDAEFLLLSASNQEVSIDLDEHLLDSNGLSGSFAYAVLGQINHMETIIIRIMLCVTCEAYTPIKVRLFTLEDRSIMLVDKLLCLTAELRGPIMAEFLRCTQSDFPGK